MTNSKTAFVLSEDRPEFEESVRICIFSLTEYVKCSLIRCFLPWANESFLEWSGQFANVEIRTTKPDGADAWNCKPHCMIPLLEEGYKEVIWVDSDILINGDPFLVFRKFHEESLIVAEEPWKEKVPDASEQASAWGWKPGRKIKSQINSCVIRAFSCHLELLTAWKKSLQDKVYCEYQKKPFHPSHRPSHMMGDQDVLYSLLGSSHFSDVKLDFISIGVDIIHCGNASLYSLKKRFLYVFKKTPCFLHAIAGKPFWIFSSHYAKLHRPFVTWIHRLQQEISPYVIKSRRLHGGLGISVPWSNYHSLCGILLRIISLDHHALLGLPICVAQRVFKYFKIY